MLAPPVLVLAPPGPNSARLAAMLGNHPRAQQLPELCAFLAPTIGGLLELLKLADTSPMDGLMRSIAAIHGGGQNDEGIQLALHWLRRRADWSGAMLLDSLARSLAPRLLVSADTHVGWRPDQLDRLYDSCPDLRVLHLIQHPRPYCRECAKDLDGRLFVPPDFKDCAVYPPTIDPQLAWHRVHTNIERAFESVDAAQYRRVRVEDLHAQPEATLTGLCDWLGLPVDETAMIRMLHPELAPFSSFGPQSAPRGSHDSFLESPRFLRTMPSRESLHGPLEWREHGLGFAADVFHLAAGYRYN